jgi:RNA polymerase sigma-70 factor (ECF subfamily)
VNGWSEKAAVARLKSGDIRGLAALVEAHQVKAARAAHLIVRDPALAQDIVQAAFVRFYERIGSYDSTRPFAPYFMRIVVNDALAALRIRGRTTSLDAPVEDSEVTLEDLLADPAPTPDDALEQAELRDAVEAALEKLSPEQRAAVVLRYYLGLNEADMAASLDVPPGTVKWRLHAAKKQLGTLLRPFRPSPALED